MERQQVDGADRHERDCETIAACDVVPDRDQLCCRRRGRRRSALERLELVGLGDTAQLPAELVRQRLVVHGPTACFAGTGENGDGLAPRIVAKWNGTQWKALDFATDVDEATRRHQVHERTNRVAVGTTSSPTATGPTRRRHADR
jgi:hypothetical protein